MRFVERIKQKMESRSGRTPGLRGDVSLIKATHIVMAGTLVLIICLALRAALFDENLGFKNLTAYGTFYIVVAVIDMIVVEMGGLILKASLDSNGSLRRKWETVKIATQSKRAEPEGLVRSRVLPGPVEQCKNNRNRDY